MSRVFGVDIRDNHVRVAALRVGYRKLDLDGLAEHLVSGEGGVSAALASCLTDLGGSPDTVVSSVDGSHCFLHRVMLPLSAKKRLADLLPFELEAVLPLDVEELVVDHTVLPESMSHAPGQMIVLAVAARTTSVQAQIDLIRNSLGHTSERVGCSSTELGQLVHLSPSLMAEEPIALVDLGFLRTDVCVVTKGVVQQARALNLGVDSFPEKADTFVARLRQTISAAFTTFGRPVSKVVIMGDGVSLAGLDKYLTSRLEVPVELLPELNLGGADAVAHSKLPLFGRAIAMAMHGVRGKGFDLRQGSLAFERGYEHVKERAPLLGGLLAATMLSFLFAVWAESQALASQNEALLTSLEEITLSTFGEGTQDPDEAEVALARARSSKQEDPMPYLDGFGVAVALSETLPVDIVHDVEELEVSKGKVKLRGIVGSAEEAQKVAKAFGEHRCISTPDVTKISQVVNTDRERYVLETQVLCPEDQGFSVKAKDAKKGGEE